jgi:hypothetical protein
MPTDQEFEKFANALGVPKAFVRLLVDAGFPLEDGKLNEKNYADWLIEHYPDVRRLAGLEPLPPIDGVTGMARANLQIHNVLRTVMDFLASRSTRPEIKQAWEERRRQLEAELDGH